MLNCNLFDVGKKVILNQSYDCEFNINLKQVFGDFIYYNWFLNNTCNKPSSFDCNYTNHLNSLSQTSLYEPLLVGCSNTKSCGLNITISDTESTNYQTLTITIL